MQREIQHSGEATTIARQDAYYWRIVATGLCFTLFGLGGIVLGLLVFPVLRLLPGGKDKHRARALRTIQGAMRAFIYVMRSVGVLTYDFEGVSRLGRPGQVILANHPSLIDVVFLIGFSPSSSCVVKQALWRNPVTRGPVNEVGYVSNSPTDLMIEKACRALEAGQSVIIFPEGTRTTPGRPLQFHRGAAVIAIKAAAVVTPVFIECRPTTLSKGEPWYRVPDKRVHFSFRVGDDIDPEPFRKAAPGPIAGRAFNEFLLKLFEAELAGNRRADRDK
jgi:1-acyl-sn-glycerol-3-phosphate acyltransferase